MSKKYVRVMDDSQIPYNCKHKGQGTVAAQTCMIVCKDAQGYCINEYCINRIDIQR